MNTIHKKKKFSNPFSRKTKKKLWKYTLVRDWTHFTCVKFPGNSKPFENEWFYIDPRNGEIIVRKGYSFDGATMVPDTYCAVEAAKAHDPLFQFAREIAELWNCKPRDVVRFANRVFCEIAHIYSKHNLKIQPKLLCLGVKIFGWPAWNVFRFFERHKKPL